MKIVNTLLLLNMLFVAALPVQAQSSKDNQAKAYYFVALEAFEAKQYDEVLASIKNVEDLLGSSNARLSALKVKTYFEQNKLDKAKTELDRFFSFPSSDEQGREMATYLRNINSGHGPNEIEAEKLAQQKKERLKAQRPQMIADFNDLKDQYINYLKLKNNFENEEEVVKNDFSRVIKDEQYVCNGHNQFASYETVRKSCRLVKEYQSRQEAWDNKYWAYKARERKIKDIESSTLSVKFHSQCNELSEIFLSISECSQKTFD